MEAGFARIEARFDALHRLLFQATIALLVGLLGVVVALIT